MGRWGALLVVLAVASPATARGASEQVIAARDVRADIAVDGEGRAFVVSRGRGSVRLRSAAHGRRFGPWRTLVHSTRKDRAVDAAIASDGSGAIVVQRGRRVRVVPFDARGRVGAPAVVSRGRTADFAASAVARGGAAIVVWFRHVRARRWRLEASVREPGAPAFGAPQPLSRFVQRACCTNVAVAIADGGDAVATWRSTARPAVWASVRAGGERFRRAQRLAGDSSDVPKAAVGAGGMAAVTYSVQHVPVRAGDGLRLHRAVNGRTFGAPETVNPGGGTTIGEVMVTPAGRVFVAWVDQAGGRVRVSESGPAGPLAATGAVGTDVAPRAPAVAAADDGRAVVAWSQRVSSERSYSEQPVAATRQSQAAEFGPAVALGPPWRIAEPGLARLIRGGGAVVAWRGSHFGRPGAPREVLAVTRLP